MSVYSETSYAGSIHNLKSQLLLPKRVSRFSVLQKEALTPLIFKNSEKQIAQPSDFNFSNDQVGFRVELILLQELNGDTTFLRAKSNTFDALSVIKLSNSVSPSKGTPLFSFNLRLNYIYHSW